MPEELLKECRVEADCLWNDGKPEKMVNYAIPIILIWILLLIFIVKLLKF